MTISNEQISKLAELAKLNINDNFKDKLILDLTNILDLVDQLQTVDTANINPLVHADESAMQRLREDSVTESNDIDNMQAIAPANSTEAGLYLVPKVINHDK